MKTHKPKTDNTIRREAEVALSKLGEAINGIGEPSTQEEVDALWALLREVYTHSTEVEFLARKGYAILKRAEKAVKLNSIELPAKAVPLREFQNSIKAQKQAMVAKSTAPMKKIVDADYALYNGLTAIADNIMRHLTEVKYTLGLEPTT